MLTCLPDPGYNKEVLVLNSEALEICHFRKTLTKYYEEKQQNQMNVKPISLQQPEWPIPEWRAPRNV